MDYKWDLTESDEVRYNDDDHGGSPDSEAGDHKGKDNPIFLEGAEDQAQMASMTSQLSGKIWIFLHQTAMKLVFWISWCPNNQNTWHFLFTKVNGCCVICKTSWDNQKGCFLANYSGWIRVHKLGVNVIVNFTCPTLLVRRTDFLNWCILDRKLSRPAWSSAHSSAKEASSLAPCIASRDPRLLTIADGLWRKHADDKLSSKAWSVAKVVFLVHTWLPLWQVL